MEPPDTFLLLDACCVINIRATGHEREILAAQGLRSGIVQRVGEESVYLRRGGTGEDAAERDPIDLAALIAENLLTIVRPESDREYEAFVRYAAANLHDGEAWTVAIAEVRGFAVATEDRPARRAIREGGARIVRHSTVDLLRRWVVRCGVTPDVLCRAVLAIEERARFRPRRQDADELAWWQEACHDTGNSSG